MALPRKHWPLHQPGQSDSLGGIPWCKVVVTMDGEVAENEVEYNPPFNGIIVAPLNGDASFNGDIFGFDSEDGPWTEIGLKEPGLYLIDLTVLWFQDWGRATIFLSGDNTGDPDGVNRHGGDTAVYGAAQTYQGLSAAINFQWALKHREIWAIDERAEGVTVRGVLFNYSGSDRTYPTPSGTTSMVIYRLSPCGYSNPDRINPFFT